MRRIHRNKWGNWYGYEGRRKVASFSESAELTQERAAQTWLTDPLYKRINELEKECGDLMQENSHLQQCIL